ncbi:unnamed protein product, partial [Strongylus vulgaris]
QVYREFGDNEFLSGDGFGRLLTENLCEFPLTSSICEEILYLVSGPDSNQLIPARLGVYVANLLAGTSARNIAHYSQMVHSQLTASFDRGLQENLRWYGQSSPPVYNINNVYCDTYLYYSDYDWTATARDVEQFLIPSLPWTSVKSTRNLQKFNHMDFLWGTRAREEIYDPIANIINADLIASDQIYLKH